jgi:hypothetical protein
MMTPNALSPDLRRALDCAAQGERILWSGQPKASRMWPLFGIWLFAVPWTAFAIFWESIALMPWAAGTKTPDGITHSFGIIMPLFGLPFVLIGLGMMAAPFWAMAKAKSTVHALTDKRLLTIVTGRSTKVTAVAIDRTGPVETGIGPDGSGSFKVQTGSHIDSDGDRVTDRFEFAGIDNVAELERAFRTLKQV